MSKRIPLRAKDGSIKQYTTVDDEDYERLGHLSWYLVGTGYAAREKQIEGRRFRIYLHRAIMGLEHGDGFQVDHINCEELDNRRSNLRIVTNAENKQNKRPYSNNKSGYRGVSWNKRAGKWCAQYRVGGKSQYIGLFDDPKEAGAVAALARSEEMPYAN